MYWFISSDGWISCENVNIAEDVMVYVCGKERSNGAQMD